jgi:hypothetical protein
LIIGLKLLARARPPGGLDLLFTHRGRRTRRPGWLRPWRLRSSGRQLGCPPAGRPAERTSGAVNPTLRHAGPVRKLCRKALKRCRRTANTSDEKNLGTSLFLRIRTCGDQCECDNLAVR